jgi:hypothetical protein
MSTTHLSDDALVEALEGAVSDAARRHVSGCAACRSRIDAALEGLAMARGADVPEPSPLYWEAFRRQVGRRIAADPRSPSRWPLAAGLAAAAALVAAIAIGVWKAPFAPARPPAVLPAWSALPPAEEDVGFAILEGLETTSDDWAVATCAGIAECVAGLSDEESLAVAGAFEASVEGMDL